MSTTYNFRITVPGAGAVLASETLFLNGDYTSLFERLGSNPHAIPADLIVSLHEIVLEVIDGDDNPGARHVDVDGVGTVNVMYIDQE